MNAARLCEAIAASPLSQKKLVQETQQHAARRIQVVTRSLASSGVGACLLGPQLVLDEIDPAILLELEVVSRELEWRLRDIARDLALRLSSQGEEVNALFAGLIETLDQLS